MLARGCIRSADILQRIFFFNDPATTEIYTLSLHDALPIFRREPKGDSRSPARIARDFPPERSEEHTSELQSQFHLVCRLLLEKKKINTSRRLGSRHSRAPLALSLLLACTTHVRVAPTLSPP